MVLQHDAEVCAKANPFFTTITSAGYVVSTCTQWLLPPDHYADTGISDFRCSHWGGLWYKRYDPPFSPGGLSEAHADIVDRVERGEIVPSAECRWCAERPWQRPEAQG